MNRKTTLLLIAVSSALILGLWLGAWYVGTQLVPMKAFTNQPLADVFSSINALFAGFAFCGVILTVYLQIQELQDTRQVLLDTANANIITADYSKTNAIVELNQTYWSEYFLGIKNSAFRQLIPAMASRHYFEVLISQFFIAERMMPSKESWHKISQVSLYKTFEEFDAVRLTDYRNLRELINFFTILAYHKDAKDIIARCDFEYSNWRPMFWMIAIAQETIYLSDVTVRKYSAPFYFKEAIEKLDFIYGFTPIRNANELISFLADHPKLVKQYNLDKEHLDLAQWVPVG